MDASLEICVSFKNLWLRHLKSGHVSTHGLRGTVLAAADDNYDD